MSTSSAAPVCRLVAASRRFLPIGAGSDWIYYSQTLNVSFIPVRTNRRKGPPRRVKEKKKPRNHAIVLWFAMKRSCDICTSNSNVSECTRGYVHLYRITCETTYLGSCRIDTVQLLRSSKFQKPTQ